MSLSRNAFLLASLSIFSISAFAADGETVTRHEKTGQKRVMKVGRCSWKHNLDFNGNLRLGYDLPVTYCIEYRTFKAKQVGSGWTAKYEPVTEPKISYQMDIESHSFANHYTANDTVDEALIQLALSSQCQNMRKTLQRVEDSRDCR